MRAAIIARIWSPVWKLACGAWVRITSICSGSTPGTTTRDLVRAGKVLYIGVSDTPAWVASASNVLAELRGWTQYVGLQIEYSLLERTPERDLLPMADHFEISVLAWDPVGAGVPHRQVHPWRGQRLLAQAGQRPARARGLAIARAVDQVADELGVTSAQVAIAWVLSRGYRCILIVGARKVEQIKDNLESFDVRLSDAQLEKLDTPSRIQLGFPQAFLQTNTVRDFVRTEARSRLEGRLARR